MGRAVVSKNVIVNDGSLKGGIVENAIAKLCAMQVSSNKARTSEIATIELAIAKVAGIECAGRKIDSCKAFSYCDKPNELSV